MTVTCRNPAGTCKIAVGTCGNATEHMEILWQKYRLKAEGVRWRKCWMGKMFDEGSAGPGRCLIGKVLDGEEMFQVERVSRGRSFTRKVYMEVV